MRRTATILLVLALGGVVLAGVGLARTAQTARLRLVTLNPLTVAATGFHSRERERVTATSAGATQTVRVIATRTGSFRVTFGELTPSRCDLVRVVAVSRAGTTVVLKRLPLVACMPERSSGSSA
jgi:hypothetical protein